MPSLSARRALEYAISPPVLRLFGVILLGGLLLQFGVGFVGRGLVFHRGGVGLAVSLLELLAGLALTVAGLLGLYGGMVGLLYKVIVDAVGDADQP